MPVNPDDIDSVAATTAEIYREAENALIRLIRHHLDQGMDAPTWAQDRLAAVSALRRAAQSIVAGLSADAGDSIRQTVASAYRTGRGAALVDLPEGWFPRSGIGQAARVATAVVRQTGAVESLAAALVTDIGEHSRNIVRDVVDTYRSVIAGATGRILTANETRRQAAQHAWAGLVRRGITGFTDRSGRRWQLSSYVEMATRTVTARAAVQGQTDRLASLGLDLVTVSNAPQECKLCRPFEGKVLRRDHGLTGQLTVEHQLTGEPVEVNVVATLDNARRAGLFHPNCRHSVSAYLPGVTRLPSHTADPDGDQARQRQRAIERKIRRWKDAEEAALTPQAKAEARRRVRAAQAELRDHLAAHPQLKRLRHRESRGAGNIPPPGRGDAAAGVGPGGQPTLDSGPAGTPARRLPTGVDRDREVHAGGDDIGSLPGQGVFDFDAAARRARDPLDGVDLQAIPEDDLFELFSQVSALDDVDELTLRRLLNEMEHRERAPAPASPSAGDWLNSGPVDERYDWPDPDDLTPEQHRLDELLDAGRDYISAYAEVYGVSETTLVRQEAVSTLERQAGETLDQAVRRAYDEWLHRQYLAAEEATRGHVLSDAGAAAHINSRTLFSGPLSRARKYASEDLLRWWAENERLTLTEFRARTLGREQDIAAAERIRLQSNDQDFI